MGMKTRGYAGQRNRLWWVRVGEGVGQGLLGWKHACLSIDWETGDVFLVENGQVVFNERVRSVAKARKDMNSQVDTFTVGCFHGYGFVSTRGPVTDFHVYSRNLYTEEIMNFTMCSSTYPVGNIINWNTANWKLQTKNNLSEVMETYFAEDVCSTSSTVLIPVSSTKPDPCQQISGHTIGYHTKEELHTIARQLARNNNLADRGLCMSSVPGLNNTFKTFLPTSIRRSGAWNWTNSLTMSEVTYLPWAENRSVIQEDEYECAFLELVIESQLGHEFGKLLSVEITGLLKWMCLYLSHTFICPQIISVTTTESALPAPYPNPSLR